MISIRELVAVLVVPIELLVEIHHARIFGFSPAAWWQRHRLAGRGPESATPRHGGATVLLIQDLSGQWQLQSGNEVMRMVVAQKSIVDLHLLGTWEDAAADHRAVGD